MMNNDDTRFRRLRPVPGLQLYRGRYHRALEMHEGAMLTRATRPDEHVFFYLTQLMWNVEVSAALLIVTGGVPLNPPSRRSCR